MNSAWRGIKKQFLRIFFFFAHRFASRKFTTAHPWVEFFGEVLDKKFAVYFAIYFASFQSFRPSPGIEDLCIHA